MIFSDDLGSPEGPVLLPDNSWVVVEMHVSRGCLTHISADSKTRRMIAKTGRPNGLTIDKNGDLWVAESVKPASLLRVTMDGHVDIIMTDCNGEPFLFPNDLCFGPDGALYMTDSGYLCTEWMRFSIEQRQKHAGRTDGRVYRIDLSDKSIEKLDSGIPFANGIAFGPDKNLYVSSTPTGMIFRYSWSDGKIGPREDFGNVINPNAEGVFRGPDGMAFDQNGYLYVAVVRQGDVTVLDPEGAVVKRISTAGPCPTNVAFGPTGSGKIFVTEMMDGNFEVFDVDADGLPLYN